MGIEACPQRDYGRRITVERPSMPLASKSRQKWPRLIVVVTLVLSVFVTLAFPPRGVAQDDQELPLNGAFTVTIGQRDIPPGLADGTALAGTWSVDFGSDGAFSVTRLDVGEVASGTFESGATTVTFDEWSGLVGCSIEGENVGATYSWRRSESTLTLTPIREACAERITLLSTRSLGSNAACAGNQDAAAGPPIGDAFDAGTPVAEVPGDSGVTAQEGLSESAQTESAVDDLLGRANGCWASGDPQSFLALQSDAAIQSLIFMAPPDVIVSQLRQAMMSPASFERIGDVNVNGSDSAWAYVQFTFDDEPTPLRVEFVNQHGQWLFDTYIPSVLSTSPSINGPS
jgi:hypothetical protein